MVQLLLVDDDKDMLRFLHALLETRSFAVTTCTDAIDALEKLKGQPFDIVISDANMPGVSGFDLVKTIRSQPQFNDLGIALLTSRRDRKDVERAMNCGADDYIIKPVDPDVLFHKLEDLMKKRPPTLRPTIQFAETRTSFPVQIAVQGEIESVSEVELHFSSPTFFEAHSKISLETPLFSEIGITPPLLKVQNSEPITLLGRELFRTRVSFIGMAEKDMQKLRAWVHYNSTYRKGAA